VFSNLALMPFMSRPVAIASCNLILALTGLRKPAEIQSRPAGTAPSLLWCQRSISGSRCQRLEKRTHILVEATMGKPCLSNLSTSMMVRSLKEPAPVPAMTIPLAPLSIASWMSFQSKLWWLKYTIDASGKSMARLVSGNAHP
jgi:hypothetical protein